MINFTLPNFYQNFTINNKMSDMTKEHSEYFKTKINFSYATGNFPYCYWNGGYNNNKGDGAFYDDFINTTNLSNIPLRFNCANICLQEQDYINQLANLILQLNENGSNIIELCDIKLLAYLKERYPNYQFCWSKEAVYLYQNEEYNVDLINLLNEKGLFHIISLPEAWTQQLDLIKQIQKRNSIEVAINTSCNQHCPHYHQCKVHEHEAQYTFSNVNQFQECKEKVEYDKIKPLITLEDIQKDYIPLGIKYYGLAETACSDRHDYINFLVNYFIKPEYQLKAYQILLGVE